MKRADMRILLTRPQHALVSYRYPDIGLGYLATGMRSAGFTPILHVPDAKGWNTERAVKTALESRVNIVGIKVMTADLAACRQLYAALHLALPHVPVILGGPHVSGAKEAVFSQFPGLKYAFVGEADRSLPQFAALLQSSGCSISSAALRAVPGLMWYDNGKLICNSVDSIEDLDAIGWPAWDLLEPEKTHVPFNVFYSRREPIVGITTARGCTSHCTYCAIHLIEGRRYRARSAEHVLDEMELLVRRHGVREIQFVDSNCIQDRDRMIKICQGIIERKLNIAWSCPNGVKAGSLDDELVRWMGKSGCHFVFLGIETGSQKIQIKIRKGLNLAQLPEKIALLKRHGINVGGFFMIGFPDESREEISQTVNLALSLDIDVAAISVLVPLPGSEIFGQLHPEITSRYTDCVFQDARNDLSQVSAEELLAIAGRAFIRLSMKPSRYLFFLKNLNSVHKWKHLGASFYRHLRHSLRSCT